MALGRTSDQNLLQEPIFKRFINPDDRECQEKARPPEFGISARITNHDLKGLLKGAATRAGVQPRTVAGVLPVLTR
jgi:hypothetical protein